MVENNWVANMNKLIIESTPYYLKSHLDKMNEHFMRNDVDWNR
jgi:hypothetical protein